jgi:hypothetical protein
VRRRTSLVDEVLHEDPDAAAAAAADDAMSAAVAAAAEAGNDGHVFFRHGDGAQRQEGVFDENDEVSGVCASACNHVCIETHTDVCHCH